LFELSSLGGFAYGNWPFPAPARPGRPGSGDENERHEDQRGGNGNDQAGVGSSLSVPAEPQGASPSRRRGQCRIHVAKKEGEEQGRARGRQADLQDRKGRLEVELDRALGLPGGKGNVLDPLSLEEALLHVGPQVIGQLADRVSQGPEILEDKAVSVL